MIDLALKARIPLIHVHTTDTVNVSKILRHISGKPEVKRWDGETSSVSEGSIFYCISDPCVSTKQTPATTELSHEGVKSHFELKQSSLVMVNVENIHSLVFDAGELPTPKALKLRVLTQDLGQTKTAAEDLVAAMGGLTLSECDWAIRLTHVQDQSLTRTGIARTRKKVFPPKPGLEQVDTDQGFYLPPAELTEWLQKEAHFFLTEPDKRLRPKGILFGGPPGTGKTAGAKHIARTLGVPLFRYDASEVKSKWVGESESNLKRTLQAAAHEAPCVLLLDEVEKQFNALSMDHSGVTTNLLSDFLWFLQENESRVLVVMTTNGKHAIPAPLIRPGRIDRHLEMNGLPPEEIWPFMKAILDTYGLEPDTHFQQLGKEVQKTVKEHIPQADVEQRVIDYVKLVKAKVAATETPKKKLSFKSKAAN